jgi:hypothetical protein
MTTPITINVKNNSTSLQNFFFFQQPAQYSGGAQVYTNSLYTAPLLPFSQSGSQLAFSMILQYYAGVEQQVAPPQVGVASGQLAAMQPINVTPATGAPIKNVTNMTVSPSLGLSPPLSLPGPQTGSFRIVTPTFNTQLANYNAGSAVSSLTGGITLSNFVTAMPNNNLDCQPVIVFYVQTGTYTPGTVMNFTSSSVNAGVCDFTPGYTTYNVEYSSSGTWTAKAQQLVTMADGSRRLVDASGGSSGPIAPPNAEVRNEAGTGVVSTGNAADFNSPVTITNLSNPGGIQQFHEYQVGPAGGPYQGLMCDAIAGNTANFS